MELKNNNGTQEYKKLSLDLRKKGITEEQYRSAFEKKYPFLEKRYTDTLMEILFHTF